jgi:serine protease Do
MRMRGRAAHGSEGPADATAPAVGFAHTHASMKRQPSLVGQDAQTAFILDLSIQALQGLRTSQRERLVTDRCISNRQILPIRSGLNPRSINTQTSSNRQKTADANLHELRHFDARRDRNFSVSAAIATSMLGALILLFAGSLPAQTASTPERPRADLLKQLSTSINDLTSRVSPSVVQVLVTGLRALDQKDEDDTALIGRQRSLASGVIVDPDGYIITNAHVVKGAQRVRVMLTSAFHEESQVRATLGEHLPPLDAKVVGVAPAYDLALLKIDAKGLPAMVFADYWKLQKGQLVLAFGNPEGLENSVTLGIVSAVARQADPSHPFVFIQTDAPINPGNSGGALVNTDGELVGINTFILSESGGSQGLGFAIPSSVVSFVYGQLRKQGHVHHSIIGATLQEISPDLAAGLNLQKRQGVVVSDVTPGGPSEKAGMKIQDVLLSLDGSPVGSVALAEMVISTRPGDAVVKAEVLRGTEKVSLEIPVTQERDDVDRMADLMDPTKSLVSKLGIFGVEINDKLAEEMEGDLRVPSGVIVAAIAANTLGADTGLQTGDVIHSVNTKHIETLDALRAALDAIPPRGSVVLQIEREHKYAYLAFELD